jgi:hypothetical protein
MILGAAIVGGFMKRPAKEPSKLSDSVHHQLSMYALAASAAGVGMLALAQPAESKIVYTPLHTVLHAGDHYYLSFQGRPWDFYFQNFKCQPRACTSSASKSAQGFFVQGKSISVSFMTSSGGGAALALKNGARIPQCPSPQADCSAPMVSHAVIAEKWNSHFVRGNWFPNVKNRYLGLTFRIDGHKHYGWVRVSVKTTNNPFFADWHFDGLRLRDDPQQAHHRGQDQRAGCHHRRTREPRSPSPRCIRDFHVAQSRRQQMKRQSKNLSSALEQRLSMYALAASAAGVSLLALPHPAEAKIVYTKTHQLIYGVGHFVNLDLNHDGHADFRFVVGGASHGSFLAVYSPSQDNRISTTSKIRNWAAAFPAGVRIGAGGKGSNASAPMEGLFFGTPSSSYQWGNWLNVKNRYLGLAFKIKGKTHYGWARLSATVGRDYGVHATLTGYAYETIPNKAIITGKTEGPDVIRVTPATLGHLARGASSVSAWRVKRIAATTH